MEKKYERRMEQVEVYLNDAGGVTISQQHELEDLSDIVALTPEQVPIVIQWLQDALAELHDQTHHS